MHISAESSDQTALRLQRVIVDAELTFLPGEYAFEEFPVAQFPTELINDAIAFVRDDAVWSVLRPAIATSPEKFAVFRFHFRPQFDNSGFVGWLASQLKQSLGTGVLVVCGQNSRRGGIFDYWGVPVALRQQVEIALAALRHPRS